MIGNQESLIEMVDAEIARLQQVREILSGTPQRPGMNLMAGRYKPVKVVKKRTMSADGRARIAAAQKARWAKQKAQAKMKKAA